MVVGALMLASAVMAKKKPLKAKRRKSGLKRKAARPRDTASRPKAPTFDALLAPVKGAIKRDIGHVQLEVGRAGSARVKRMIYPPGFHWLVDMKPVVGTDLCMHAHVGFIARGQIGVRYGDGCTVEFAAPQAVAIDPGHEGWVVGDEPAVLIEIDFEGETANRFGLTGHRHAK